MQQPRGKLIFFTVTSVVILELTAVLLLTISSDLELSVKLSRIIPLAAACYLVFQFLSGHDYWRILFGVRYISNGIFSGIVALTARLPTSPGWEELLLNQLLKLPVLMAWLYCLFCIAVGTLFLFAQSMRAYCASRQRPPQ